MSKKGFTSQKAIINENCFDTSFDEKYFCKKRDKRHTRLAGIVILMKYVMKFQIKNMDILVAEKSIFLYF